MLQSPRSEPRVLVATEDVGLGSRLATLLSRLTAVKERRPDLAVLVLSARPTIQLATAVIRGGAEDLVPVPYSEDVLRKEVERILESAELRDRVETLHSLVADAFGLARRT